jgi:hypothetical protein
VTRHLPVAVARWIRVDLERCAFLSVEVNQAERSARLVKDLQSGPSLTHAIRLSYRDRRGLSVNSTCEIGTGTSGNSNSLYCTRPTLRLRRSSEVYPAHFPEKPIDPFELTAYGRAFKYFCQTVGKPVPDSFAMLVKAWSTGRADVVFRCLRLTGTCSASLAHQPKTRACSRMCPRRLHRAAAAHCVGVRTPLTTGWRRDVSGLAWHRARSNRARHAESGNKGFAAQQNSPLTGSPTVWATWRPHAQEDPAKRWRGGSIPAVASFESFDLGEREC